MTIVYPGIGGKPLIVACAKCVLSDLAWHVPMLLDTGADSSCFPAHMAGSFDHDNLHPDVVRLKNEVHGIGGTSDAFIHSVCVGLIHPSKSTRQKTVLAWQSPIEKTQFVEKMDCKHGLIGMDIMRQWKQVKFERYKKSGILISITF
ncbi:MAG: hypothetical protein KGJ88_06575 [Verrucomicrobiota bacterium]|nr:hypothetical protein [Verrucomicrobiota bacterium]